ncbi:hypothetical protein WJX79_001170 [Trebouxia sp. C0005]
MSLLTRTLSNAWFCQSRTDTHHIGGWRQRRPSRAYLDCSKLHRNVADHSAVKGKRPVSNGKDRLPSNDKGSSSADIAGLVKAL